MKTLRDVSMGTNGTAPLATADITDSPEIVKKSESQLTTTPGFPDDAPPEYTADSGYASAPGAQGHGPVTGDQGYPGAGELPVLMTTTPQGVNIIVCQHYSSAGPPGDLHEYPTQTICPTCQVMILTSISRRCTIRTHLASLVTAVITGIICLVLYMKAEQKFGKSHIFFLHVPFIIALFLFIFCFCPSIFIPYCLPTCKETRHSCPHCKAEIGFLNTSRYSRCQAINKYCCHRRGEVV